MEGGRRLAGEVREYKKRQGGEGEGEGMAWEGRQPAAV